MVSIENTHEQWCVSAILCFEWLYAGNYIFFLSPLCRWTLKGNCERERERETETETEKERERERERKKIIYEKSNHIIKV